MSEVYCSKPVHEQSGSLYSSRPAATQFKQPVHHRPGSPSSQALATMVNLQTVLLALLATLHHDGTAAKT